MQELGSAAFVRSCIASRFVCGVVFHVGENREFSRRLQLSHRVYHASPVHALTLKGGWGYAEHTWHATAGTYVFEPPGETHTLQVDADCEEMIALFHVTGALLYVDPATGNTIGYDDVFTKLEKARAWYEKCGLGASYAEQFIR